MEQFIAFVIADLRAHLFTLIVMGVLAIIFLLICYEIRRISPAANAPIPKKPDTLEVISEDLKEIKELLKNS